MFDVLQEVSLKSTTSSMGMNDSVISVEKSRNDDYSTGKSRGWLNWLSRGMLGAGGTDDSSQFSGVVSEELIKVPMLIVSCIINEIVLKS